MICAATLSRVPNMLPGEDDLIQFLSVLVTSVGALQELQLSAVPPCVIIAIGRDAPAAFEWVVLVRVLK